MRSVLMMTLANLRKRFSQSLLILVTILMSSLLLATAVGVLDNIRSPFENMFESQQGSHITMQLSDDFHDAEGVVRWWSQQEAVANVHLMPFVMSREQIWLNDNPQSMGNLMLTEHPGAPLTYDQLMAVEGITADSPGENEVWIPTGYAYAWGIKPGDTLGVVMNESLHTMTVSALVVDPQFSIGMMNPVRAWVSADTLKHLANSEKGSLIGVRLADYSRYDSLWASFEEQLGTPFMGFVFDYEFVRHSYSMVESIIGAVILLFAAIIILVAVYVIYFTISNAILTDYKLIGILKAQGFSSNQVRNVYLLQYLALTSVAVPIGIFLSSSVAGLVLAQMARSLGLARLGASLLLPALITATTIFAAVVATAMLSAAKAARVKPAEAIMERASAITSPRGRIDLTKIRTLPVSLLLGIRNMVSGRRQSVLMMAAALVMSFVVVFSLNAYNSMRNLGQNLAWWGFDASEVFMSVGSNTNLDHERLLAVLDEDPRVVAAVPHGILLTAIAAQGGQGSRNLVAFVYGGDMDAIGMVNLEGKHPLRVNEAAISVIAAQHYGKTVGDTMELYVAGQKGTYLVTGVYQSLNSGGWGFRMQERAVQRVNPDFRANTYSVKLQDGVDPNLFVADMKRQLGEDYNIRTAADSGELNFSGVTSNMALVAVVLSTVFMAVAFIITFNTTLMSIYSDRKSYGIYKALGMTPMQIRMSLVSQALALASIGIALGMPLSLVAAPRLLSALIRNVGLVRFPFDVTIAGTLAAIPICLAIAFLSVWLPSRKILSFNPRDLIVD